MHTEVITNSQEETQSLGMDLAKKLEGGEIICLDGELGAGKTTFTQGLLAGLGVEGPYTSPTFLIMKEYETETSSGNPPAGGSNSKIDKIYHIDAYRISEEDLLNLGWEEISSNKNSVVIVEWPERVKKILPKNAIKIAFKWVDPPRSGDQSLRVEAGENRRKITFA